MLLWLMNLDWAAGDTVVPPPPINDQSGDGFRRNEAYRDDEQKGFRERLRKQAIEEDEIFLSIIQGAMRFLN